MNIFDFKRDATHPGEVLREEFLKPLNLKQTKLAINTNKGVRFIYY